MRLYVAALALAALIVGISLVSDGPRLGTPWVLGAFLAASAVSERWSVALGTTHLSAYLLPTVLAGVLISPLAAALVGATAMIGDLLRPRPDLLRWATYTCAGFLTGASAGAAASAISSVTTGSRAETLMAAAFVGMAAAEALDCTLAVTTARMRGRCMSETIRRIGPIAVTSFMLYAPLIAILAWAYVELSPWTAPLFLVPALALQRVYALYQRQRRLTDELTETNTRLSQANDDLRGANVSFATALVQTLEESDRYTAGHSRAVANYTRDIARAMNMSEAQQERLYLCGLVHDIGKIGLAASVLNKEGRLTLEERREMEKHSEIGERILAKVEAYSDIARIVRHHHERLDGEGYPDKLRGAEIPVESRIIAVADAYNAMTSDRPYRKAMDYHVARDRLLQAMGSQFFTEPVVAFLSVLAIADDGYRYARDETFGPVDLDAAYALLAGAESSPDLALGAA